MVKITEQQRKVYVAKCEICNREIVSLSKNQCEQNFEQHSLKHIVEEYTIKENEKSKRRVFKDIDKIIKGSKK